MSKHFSIVTTTLADLLGVAAAEHVEHADTRWKEETRMNRTTTTAAVLLASCSAAALAQLDPGQSVTVNLTHDDADGTILVGESVNWRLSVIIDGFQPSEYVASMDASILANGATLVESSDLTYLDDDDGFVQTGPFFSNWSGGTFDGESDGQGGIGLIRFINYQMIEEWADADMTNPFSVGEFTTTALNPGTLHYSLIDGSDPNPFLEIGIGAFGINMIGIEEVTFDIDTLTIVPAPASALLLASAGLIAVRRRR